MSRVRVRSVYQSDTILENNLHPKKVINIQLDLYPEGAQNLRPNVDESIESLLQELISEIANTFRGMVHWDTGVEKVEIEIGRPTTGFGWHAMFLDYRVSDPETLE